MMVNGVWKDNATCKHCRYRHPPELTCGEAQQQARNNNPRLFERPVVPCKWCGDPTNMAGTQMCDGCWELDRRIRGDMELAERILNHYKEEQKSTPMFRVINTDNFGSDYPNERFVTEELTEAQAAKRCHELNEHLTDTSSRYHRVVPVGYVLQGGFEP